MRSFKVALASTLIVSAIAPAIADTADQRAASAGQSESAQPIESAPSSETAPASSESAPSNPEAADTSASTVETVPVDPAATPGPAEDAQPTRSVGISINEIVVTAQKREESANTVPIAISAFTGEQLQDLGVVDTRDLSSIVPGFTAADNGYNTPVYTLRGIGYADTTYTATSTVGVYVDEVSLPYGIMTKGANLDIQRVEVLKGPQGTLYGRNTTGGAINYIANKPTDSLEYGVTAGVGAYETGEFEGFLSGPLLDSLTGRIAVKTIESGKGWQYSQTRPEDHLGKKDKQSGRALLDWKPADSFSVRFSLDGWIDRSDSQAAQAVAFQPQTPFIPNSPFDADFPILGPIIGVNPGLVPSVRNYPLIPLDTNSNRVADWPEGGPWFLDDHYWGTSLRTNWDVSDQLLLTGIASYGRVESDGSGIANTGLDVYNVEQVIDAHIATTSGELRLSNTSDGDFHWMIGVNAARDKGAEYHDVDTTTNSALFPDPVTQMSLIANGAVTYGETKARSLGVFANSDWQFTDTLKATLGARYSKERRTFNGCTYEPEDDVGIGFGPVIGLVSILLYQNPTNNVQKGDCFQLDEQGNAGEFAGVLKEHNVSGRFSIDWKPFDRSLFYASFARGFKSGGFPVVNSINQSQLEPTKQEELLAYEVGAKASLIPGVLRANTAAFYYDYKDKQLLAFFKDPLFGTLPILNNIPKSTVYGVELDTQWTPVEGLFLSLSGSYIHTRIDEYDGATSSTGDTDQDYSGKPFNFTPKWQYTVLGDYSVPMTSRLVIGAGADYTYTGKTNATIEGNPNYGMRSYGLTNVRVHLGSQDKRWTLTAWGRNVFDEFVTIGVFRTGDTVARTTGMPVTYGLTLTYNGFD